MAGINMQQLMKQAQQMQQKLTEAQESMNEVTVDASAGAAGAMSEENPMAGINMQQLMKQAQQMQQKLTEAQESMNEVTVDASAGGGMVKVTVDGNMQLQSVTIDPDALDPEDVDMLQDMIVAAVNEAYRGVAEIANRRMSPVRHHRPRCPRPRGCRHASGYDRGRRE